MNTNDKSEREQPRIIRSIIGLAQSDDVYSTVSAKNFNLEGLQNAQCKEEFVKALIIKNHSDAKNLIQRIEDNHNFKGNVMSILASVYTSSEKKIMEFVFSDDDVLNFDVLRLQSIYNHYKIIAEDDFYMSRGNILNTSLYTHLKADARLVLGKEYPKSPAFIALSAKYSDSKMDELDDFLQNEEKKFVRKMSSKYEFLGNIRNVKIQLYLMYILTLRVMNYDRDDFFANGWYNFGWLKKETGFTSLFSQGINEDPWFSDVNPIFQTYNAQFRYNWGLNKDHSLPCEIVGSGKPQKPWEKLIEWASS